MKADIKEAYRMVLVECTDRIYIDKVLPFGLRSAPKIFSVIAMPFNGSSNIMGFLISCIIWMTLFLWPKNRNL